jgi:hypothetical protein
MSDRTKPQINKIESLVLTLDLWEYIAENLHGGWTPKQIKENALKNAPKQVAAIMEYGWPKNGCWLCEYTDTVDFPSCYICPADWPEIKGRKRCWGVLETKEGVYDQFCKAQTKENALLMVQVIRESLEDALKPADLKF